MFSPNLDDDRGERAEKENDLLLERGKLDGKHFELQAKAERMTVMHI